MSKQRPNNKQNYKKGGKSNYRKPHGKRGFEEAVEEVSTNHSEWLAPNDQVKRDAGSFPFSAPLGVKIHLEPHSVNGIKLKPFSIPGVLTLNVHPGIGTATSHSDPINVAARHIYSYVRHTNSGSKNYDYPDLMMYITAMSQAYALWAYMRRIYGALNMYTPVNRYYARGLVAAMGCDPEDMLYNIANLRAFINNFGYRLNQFAVPSTMPYFSRMVWYFDHVFVDSQGNKAQTYIFNPVGFYRFAIDEETSAGKLVFSRRPGRVDNGMMTYEDLRVWANSILSDILEQEDMGIMSGDILKAFQDKVFVVPETPETYLSLPEYDFNALMMIKNSTIMGTAYDDDITQTTGIGEGYLYTKPSFTINIAEFGGDAKFNDTLISVDVDHPDPDMVLRSTLLTNVLNATVAGSKGTSTCLSTSWIEGAEIFYYVYGDPVLGDSALAKIKLDDLTLDPDAVMFIDVASGEEVSDMQTYSARFLAMLSRFKCHPGIYFTFDRENDSPELIKEIETYTVMTTDDLFKLHDCIALGEFRVPGAVG